MSRYVFIVQSNPVSGRADEYNQWYENVHLDEVIAIPGFVGAQRFELYGEPFQGARPSLKYLCIYEMETDDPEGTFAALQTARPTMNVSPALDIDPSIGVTYKAIGPRHAKPG